MKKRLEKALNEATVELNSALDEKYRAEITITLDHKGEILLKKNINKKL